VSDHTTPFNKVWNPRLAILLNNLAVPFDLDLPSVSLDPCSLPDVRNSPESYPATGDNDMETRCGLVSFEGSADARDDIALIGSGVNVKRIEI